MEILLRVTLKVKVDQGLRRGSPIKVPPIFQNPTNIGYPTVSLKEGIGMDLS